MTDYIRIPLATEPADVYGLQVEDLQARMPGWQASTSGGTVSLDNALLEVVAFRLATLLDVAGSVQDTIARHELATLFGIPPDDATFATVQSTWTMRDDAGYTVPAGTEVKVQITGDQAIGFAVVDPVVVSPGSTMTATGEVSLRALVAGAQGSGIAGAAQLITPLEGPITIVLEGVSVAGRDAETDADFLDRGTRRLRRLKFGLVLPVDVEDAVREIAGVDRLLVIDNYDPGPPVDPMSGGHLTNVPIDTSGQPVSSGVGDEIDTLLADSMEQGFIFTRITPTYTDVDVDFEATAYPGFDPAAVETAAIAAVTAAVHPANHGRLPFGDQRRWIEKTLIRHGELYAVLNQVQGLDEVTSLTVNGTPDGDAVLAGPAALPEPGTITGSVT